MSVGIVHDEVEVEDFDYNPKMKVYTYPCPCGDTFEISLEDLWDGEDMATCASCSLILKVIFDEDSLPPLE